MPITSSSFKEKAVIITAVPLIMTSLPATASADKVPVAECGGNLDNPHHSHHVKTTVNAQSRIQCSTAMEEISGHVKLVRDDGKEAYSGLVVERGKDKWKANAAMNCDNGKEHEYTATVYVDWVAPGDLEPKTGHEEFSRTGSANC